MLVVDPQNIPVIDVTSNTATENHFIKSTKVKEKFYSDFLMNIYNSDFTGESSEKKALSNDDIKFLEIMNCSVKKINGHCLCFTTYGINKE